MESLDYLFDMDDDGSIVTVNFEEHLGKYEECEDSKEHLEVVFKYDEVRRLKPLVANIQRQV